MGVCSRARGGCRDRELQSSVGAIQRTCWNTLRVVKLTQALASGFSQEFRLLYKAGVWAPSLSSSEENNHLLFRYRVLQRRLGAAACVSFDWSISDSRNTISHPLRAWREVMGRARRAGSLQQLCWAQGCAAPNASISKVPKPRARWGWWQRVTCSSAQILGVGWAGKYCWETIKKQIAFSGGTDGIYYCPSACWDGNRRQPPH